VGLRLRRDELSQQASALQRRIAEGEPELTEDSIARLAAFLKEKLKDGSPELKQAYVRLVLSEVAVSDDAIRITGSKTRLAKAAATEMADTPMGVLSFVREWRPRQDSNL
jgi:site-specific DNA recombinase